MSQMSAGLRDDKPYRDVRDVNPVDLFRSVQARGEFLNVSAPMVRYSKLPFRQLVNAYHVHLTYTPMILAHEFIRHPKARNSDFTTHPTEGPVIAQFASQDPIEFARASLMIAPWVNGVDINCGCPQSWAIKEGIGCSLMGRPELVRDMVFAAKTTLLASGYGTRSVSVKIRIHKDIDETIAFLRCVLSATTAIPAIGIGLEKGTVTGPETADGMGNTIRCCDYVTVHARTRTQRSSTPPDLIALARLKSEFPDVLMLANGDVYTLDDAKRIVASTGVQGVMAARGILENPALFAGHACTPVDAVRSFLRFALASGMRYELVVHHLSEMTGKFTTKRQRRGLVEARDFIDISDWVETIFG